MEDFGDYVGQQGQQMTMTALTQVMMEVRMNKRMVLGQEITDNANREAAIFRDAVDNGRNATYDFTDGIANTVTFDLSPYEMGEDPDASIDAALENLKRCLDENGFNPDELVAVHPADGRTPHKFVYTFDDAAADKMEKVMFSWTDKICEGGGIAEKLGIQERFYQVCGFGELDPERRLAFYKLLVERFSEDGFDPEEIAVSLNRNGTLAGDLSVPVERKKILDEMCDGLSENFGARLIPMYSFSSADAITSYDANYSDAIELSRSLLQKGVDGRLTVLQNGSTLIECEPGNIPNLRDLVEAHSSEIAELAYRRDSSSSGLLKRTEKGPLSARELFKHARVAEEALKVDVAVRGAEKLHEGIGRAAERVITPPVI